MDEETNQMTESVDSVLPDSSIGHAGLTRRAAAGLLAASSFAFSRAYAADPPKDPAVFRIGALLGLTDPGGSHNGTIMRRGILQAVDDINAAGGIDGIKVEAAIEDHQGVPKGGVDALTRLRQRYDIQLLLTSYSTVTQAIAPICEQHQIMAMDGGSVSTAHVGEFKYLFRNRTLASDLARAALVPAQDLHLRKLAQLTRTTDDGVSLEKAAEAFWTAHGGKIVANEMMTPNTNNIDTQMAKLRVSGCDVLALWSFDPDPGLALKRAREFGMKQPIVGIEFTSQIASVAGPAAEGYTYASDFFDPNSQEPRLKAFNTGYVQRNHEPPEFYAASYYEGFNLLVECIRRARALGGDYFHGSNFVSALRANPVFPSVFGGDLTFRPNGVASKPIAIFIVKDGHGVFQRIVKLDAA
jgi:branched-chain amino acid transport system substrate-binding protein